MSRIILARRKSTVLWQGDVIVLGAGWAGMTAACALARAGKKTCLLEPSSTLGVELSQTWLNNLPACSLAERIRNLCADMGAYRNGRVDLVVGTAAFDRIAEEDGITGIVRVLPMRPLTHAKGELAGVEVVGKSGRQWVRAPVVIDATPARGFSRRTAGHCVRKVTSVERRLYVYGVECPDEGMRIRVSVELGLSGQKVDILPTVWSREALVSFRMDASPVTGKAEMYFRTLARSMPLMKYLRAHAPEFSSAILVGIAPEVFSACKPDNVEFDKLADSGLYPLPLAETLEQEIALAEPAVQAVLAVRRRQPLPRHDVPRAEERIKTAELTATPEQMLDAVRLPEAVAERHEPYDVLVAGGGPAGTLAALSAADRRSRAAILEPMTMLGGIGAAGQIFSYYFGTTGGLQDILDKRVADESADASFVTGGFHPIAKAVVLAQSLAENGVEVLAGHTVFGVVKRGNRVQGLLAADENGYHLFPCAVAVDATGDGDVAAAAGARFTLGRRSDGFPQPYSYTPSLIVNGELSLRNFDAGWVDPTDTLDYSRAHFEGRHALWAQGPYSEERHYCTLASLLGIRESRLIHGKATISLEDFLAGRAYPDTVCSAYANYDNHAEDYASESDWARRYVVMFGLWRHLCQGEIPYRALLPVGVEGLLVAGRALSVDHDLHQLVRMQRDMQKIGEVCGVAAALAAKKEITPARVDITELRRLLQERGILPERPPEPALNLPVPDLLNCLGTEQNGLVMRQLRNLSISGAPPDWDAFFASEHDPHRRFCAAVTTALSGFRHEGCRQELHRVLRDRVDTPRMGQKSPPCFVVAALALAEMGDTDVGGAIGVLLEEPTLDPSAIVLLFKALELTGPQGVRHIRTFLQRNGNQEFLLPLWGCDAAWTTSFRFAIELQAVSSLHALGCRDEDARLKPYLNHPNLLVRRYAMKFFPLIHGRSFCML